MGSPVSKGSKSNTHSNQKSQYQNYTNNPNVGLALPRSNSFASTVVKCSNPQCKCVKANHCCRASHNLTNNYPEEIRSNNKSYCSGNNGNNNNNNNNNNGNSNNNYQLAQIELEPISNSSNSLAHMSPQLPGVSDNSDDMHFPDCQAYHSNCNSSLRVGSNKLERDHCKRNSEMHNNCSQPTQNSSLQLRPSILKRTGEAREARTPFESDETSKMIYTVPKCCPTNSAPVGINGDQNSNFYPTQTDQRYSLDTMRSLSRSAVNLSSTQQPLLPYDLNGPLLVRKFMDSRDDKLKNLNRNSHQPLPQPIMQNFMERELKSIEHHREEHNEFFHLKNLFDQMSDYKNQIDFFKFVDAIRQVIPSIYGPFSMNTFERLFQECDRNNDGLLDFHEFLNAYAIANLNPDMLESKLKLRNRSFSNAFSPLRLNSSIIPCNKDVAMMMMMSKLNERKRLPMIENGRHNSEPPCSAQFAIPPSASLKAFNNNNNNNHHHHSIKNFPDAPPRKIYKSHKKRHESFFIPPPQNLLPALPPPRLVSKKKQFTYL